MQHAKDVEEQLYSNSRSKKNVTTGQYGFPMMNGGEEMPALDWIHYAFIAYSGCHNLVNSWHYSGSAAFFIFAVLGILTVELMLFSIYKYWKDGKLVGKMQRIGKWAGLLAMFFAVAGILAHAQQGSENEWVSLFYQWIMPSSAPVMFFFAFLIQAANPVMAAYRDEAAYGQLVNVEERRGALDQKQLELDYKSDVRLMKKKIWKDKLAALWNESDSRRTRQTLKRAMRLEMPKMLKQLGIDIDQVGYRAGFSTNVPQLMASQEDEEEGSNKMAKKARSRFFPWRLN